MPSTDLVATAARIARREHAGQVDKSGADYITHLARVATSVRTRGGTADQIATAWLHDVLEDCPVTAADLAAEAIPGNVIEAVVAMTKTRREPLDAYCARVKANPIALMVKAADIDDNTDPARVATLDEPTRTRLATKYAKARALLGITADPSDPA
ncbi:HD domain-containing protein (plasmid) [Citricoccus nitrophenolicus]